MVPKAGADPTTRAADRALALLRIVCENDGVKLADAAKAVDLSASTALRLLRISPQIYNSIAQVELLAAVLPRLLAEVG